MPVHARRKFVRHYALCSRCPRKEHYASSCDQSAFRRCGDDHHELLGERGSRRREEHEHRLHETAIGQPRIDIAVIIAIDYHQEIVICLEAHPEMPYVPEVHVGT